MVSEYDSLHQASGLKHAMDTHSTTSTPTREELNAELLEVPEPLEQPESPPPPGFEDNVEVALRHIKGRRGGGKRRVEDSRED